VRVKCRMDGELPAGRKEGVSVFQNGEGSRALLAVHGPHPAAMEDGFLRLSPVVVRILQRR